MGSGDVAVSGRFDNQYLVGSGSPGGHSAISHGTGHRTQPTMIDLTVNEIRRLINALLIEPVRDLIHRLHWSGWRRQHQLRAKRSHYTRRLNPEHQP